MEHEPLASRIQMLEQRIAELPKGSLATKTIKGHVYTYHRWYEQGSRKEKFVSADEVEELRAKIELRKALEAEQKALRTQDRTIGAPRRTATAPAPYEPSAPTRIGPELRAFSRSVARYRRRDCYRQLSDYLSSDDSDRVLILYGLRRTGKTTLIRQALLDMDDDQLSRTAFIQTTPATTLADITRDLQYLETQGFTCVFIDEVTLMRDFIQGAAVFPDIFAASGMKIVLSGTDSLGFLFSEDEQLYDRCIMVHTTFIPYREFERVLDIHGIDEYIRYAGTMSMGGKAYEEHSTFATKQSADEYVDSAIARNIQHSLACYQDGGHFRHLRELYEADELTSAINRVVEDITHRFTLEVLTRDFKSSDLALSARNLRSDRARPTDVLDRVDIASVTERLRTLLEIRNEPEQTVPILDVHRAEIEEYLTLLDLIEPIEVRTLPEQGGIARRTAIAQPGLRYAQAKALIESLLLDATFSGLSAEERLWVTERILSEVKGRMMEDIVLLETKLAQPKQQVFVLQFAIGEFDMVVHDPARATCRIFEIKHSDRMVPQQYRHLVDQEKRAMTEHRYGRIEQTCVLYRGETTERGGVSYVNVEEYLRGL